MRGREASRWTFSRARRESRQEARLRQRSLRPLREVRSENESAQSTVREWGGQVTRPKNRFRFFRGKSAPLERPIGVSAPEGHAKGSPHSPLCGRSVPRSHAPEGMERSSKFASGFSVENRSEGPLPTHRGRSGPRFYGFAAQAKISSRVLGPGTISSFSLAPAAR